MIQTHPILKELKKRGYSFTSFYKESRCCGNKTFVDSKEKQIIYNRPIFRFTIDKKRRLKLIWWKMDHGTIEGIYINSFSKLLSLYNTLNREKMNKKQLKKA